MVAVVASIVAASVKHWEKVAWVLVSRHSGGSASEENTLLEPSAQRLGWLSATSIYLVYGEVCHQLLPVVGSAAYAASKKPEVAMFTFGSRVCTVPSGCAWPRRRG